MPARMHFAAGFAIAGIMAVGCSSPPPSGGESSEPQLPKTPAEYVAGKELYDASCANCHDKTTQWSAPRLGFLRAWKSRLEQGEDQLVANAIAGIGEMPPKGDNPDLTDDDIRSIVQYMMYRAELDIPAK